MTSGTSQGSSRRSAPWSRVYRRTAFVASFAFSAFVVFIASKIVVGVLGLTRLSMGLDFIDGLERWQAGMREESRYKRVAVVGDSLFIAPPGKRGLPLTLQQGLYDQRNRGRRIRAHTLAFSGWSSAAQYYLADEIIRARPDGIVLEVNYRTLGPEPLGPFAYPELAGWIDGPRLLEAAVLPLGYAGLTADRLITARLIVASGAQGAWASLLDHQARLYHLRDPIETHLDRLLGSESMLERKFMLAAGGYDRLLVQGTQRETRERRASILGSALAGVTPDNPRLQVLAALLRHFREASIPVLVWTAPVNVEHMRAMGMNVEGLERTARSIKAVAHESGAAFADFHALLPDSLFRDSGDHPTLEGEPNGTVILGTELAGAMARVFARRSGPSERRAQVEANAVQ